MNSRRSPRAAHPLTGHWLRIAGVFVATAALAACGGSDSDSTSLSVGSTPPLGSGAPASVSCKDYDSQDIQVAPKTVAIHNNTGRTIYPVLTTSPNEVNQWIQACQRVATTIPTKLVYKLVVNQGTGIPKDSSVTITLPLYSQLPSGSKDQYITWWNGGRVILADKDTRLLDTETTDPNAKDTPMVTPGAVTCQGQGTSCQLTTYSSMVQPPVNIYAQLSEYTFGAIATPTGQHVPLLIPDNVGYNISYVDHVYLPVAIEPASNPYIGYSGSTQDITKFDNSVNNFLMINGIDNGWPVYNLAEPRHKLPGGYNIFAERAGREAPATDMPVQPQKGNPYTLTTMTCIKAVENGTQCSDEEQAKPYGAAVQSMQDLWGYCVNWTDTTWKDYVSDPNANPAIACKASPTMKSNLQLIHDFFAANYQIYENTAYPGPGCARVAPPVSFDFFQAMKHIYGWVPFNDECKNAELNPLSETTVAFDGKTWTHAQVQPLYINELQYNYKIPGNTDPIFNPYVKLIHHDLEMNAYGFSVDDSVGFMTELGSGLIFAVGSANGLPNEGQFSYADGFTVALGDPTSVPFNKPIIKSYGVCIYPDKKVDGTQCRNITQDVIMPTETKTVAFRIGTVSGYPLRVSFTDLDDNVYAFDVVAKFVAPANPDPTKTNFDPANKPALQTGVFADCSITNPNQPPDSTKVNDWCHGANPNMASDPGSTDPQTVKNFIRFPMPVGFLP